MIWRKEENRGDHYERILPGILSMKAVWKESEVASSRSSSSSRSSAPIYKRREVSIKSDQAYALRKDADNLAYELGKLREEKAKD
jgi:hypothetical protein